MKLEEILNIRGEIQKRREIVVMIEKIETDTISTDMMIDKKIEVTKDRIKEDKIGEVTALHLVVIVKVHLQVVIKRIIESLKDKTISMKEKIMNTAINQGILNHINKKITMFKMKEGKKDSKEINQD